MLKTLEIYFNANKNIHKAAEILFMHRNSLKYRLDKISELLDVDLDDAETCFRLQLMLRMRYIL